MTKLFEYQQSKVNLWKETTIRSTISRIRTAMGFSYKEPQKLLTEMKNAGYNLYGIRTTFITLGDYLAFSGRENPYPAFLKANSQVFRNAYRDKYTDLSWQTFESILEKAPQNLRLPLALLGFSGLRISELHSYNGTHVIGKGGKQRQVHVPQGFAGRKVLVSTHSVRRYLKVTCGATPHALRKLAADKMIRNGIDIKTLQVILGHEDISTTQRYLRPMEKSKLEEKLNDIWKK